MLQDLQRRVQVPPSHQHISEPGYRGANLLAWHRSPLSISDQRHIEAGAKYTHDGPCEAWMPNPSLHGCIYGVSSVGILHFRRGHREQFEVLSRFGKTVPKISRFFGLWTVNPGRVGTYNAQPRIWAGMTRTVQREVPRGLSQSRKF